MLTFYVLDLWDGDGLAKEPESGVRKHWPVVLSLMSD